VRRIFELYDLYINLDIFIWVLLRITAFLLACPLFGRKEIPSVTKIGLSIFLAYILIISGRVSVLRYPASLAEFTLVCLNETLRGMLMGFASSIIFSVLANAGRLIDTAIGFQMAEVYDPVYGAKTSVSANLLNVAAFLVFLSVNGHLHMIKILSDSYSASPIGTGFNASVLYDIVVSAFSFSFLISLKLVLPVIIIILLSEAVMGMILKFIPQMNIFIIGMPLKVLIGLFALFYLITPLTMTFDNIFDSVYEYARRISLTGV